MFSFARRASVWLAAAAVKAQDELAALGPDSRLASHKTPISGQRKTLDMNLPNQITLDTDRPSHGRVTRSVNHTGAYVGR
jgi:hypothetical protein